ncbi:DUF5681 domain-containing protein [Phenylobacterium ferrooxidans]|uniref:DUF5681 domain-containing protein n=1 Tax=Phenylobacterium ferrooxidans TaxID=2982689 RepID=UPI00366BFF2A
MSTPDDEDPGSPSKALVGYRQPPAQHQFRKGASGNPRGRPRKKAKPDKTASRASGLEDLIMQEAYRPIQIRENGKLEELPRVCQVKSAELQRPPPRRGDHAAAVAAAHVRCASARNRRRVGRRIR